MTSHTGLFPRPFLTAFLASIYIIAFIISPYWLLPASTLTKIVILTFTIGSGALWSYLSAADLQLRIDARSWISFGVLLAALVWLNYKPLTSVIPWRGDEGSHIMKTLTIVSRISSAQILLTLTLFALFLFVAWKRPVLALPAALFLIFVVVIFFVLKNPLKGLNSEYYFFLRYPFFNYWFYALIPSLATIVASPYHEILYRIIPMLSIAAIAWMFQSSLDERNSPVSLVWGLAAATVPLVLYYSSILYIEPAALFLMMIVCLQAKNLLEDDFSRIKKNPGWYALILIGFVKETAITFLFCFLACRIVFNLLRRHDLQRGLSWAASKQTVTPLGSYIWEELQIAFSVLFPYLFYIFLRSILLTNGRLWQPLISTLLDPSIYQAVGQSFVQQYGFILILFGGGCVLLVLRKEYGTASFFVLLFIAIPLFYAVDGQGEYAGYSRFNLFGVPAVLAGSSIFLSKIAGRSKIGVLALASATLLANIWMSPINLDGTKVPLWGNYLYDTSEHYYPYQDALSWLKQTHPQEAILSTGMYSPYPALNFYYNKLDWHPHYKVLQISSHDEQLISDDSKNEGVIVSKMLNEAKRDNFSIVLYQVLEKDIPQMQHTSGFRLEKVFQNDAHILVVYSRAPY